jgi:predicted nucleic acid-binding protein
VNACVLDASVAAKWCLPSANERFVPEALELWRAHEAGRLRILVPDLFWVEMGNILWKAVRAGRVPADIAHQSLAGIFSQLGFLTLSTQPLLEEAWSISTRYDRTFYDATYIALAVARNVPLVTADERLVNATAAYFPVRWLGAI